MSKRKKDKRKAVKPAAEERPASSADRPAAADKPAAAAEASAAAGRPNTAEDRPSELSVRMRTVLAAGKPNAAEDRPAEAAAKPAAAAELPNLGAAADAVPETEDGLTFHHGRSLPLPLRVKTGSLSADGFTAETAHEKFEIAWDKVKLVCLGFVAERYDTEAAAYVTEKMINDMGRMVKGGDSSEGRIVSFKESHVLDVCVEDFSEPLRFESGMINYRAFLGRVSYVSFQNYFKFVHTFVSHCRQARFNENVKLFLAWQRRELRCCAAFHEHNEEVALSLNKLDSLLRYEDLDLSRTSWAQEWTD